MVLNKLKKLNPKNMQNFKNVTLYKKFLGFLTKKGNKKKASNIIESCFLKVSSKLNYKYKKKNCSNFLLISIFKKMNTFIEVRKIRKRKNLNFVPFAIKKNRRFFLTIKWLLIAVKKSTQKISFHEKLAKEIRKILENKKNSYALELKKQNTNQSVKYRSNTHFRW